MTQDQLIAENKEEERRQDRERAAFLLKVIPDYHKTYARTKNPIYLNMAKEAGGIVNKLYKKYD